MTANLFFDQVSDNSAVAKFTPTGYFMFSVSDLATSNTVAPPLTFFAGDPTTLSISGSNPNSSGDSIMMDQQRPFGAELGNVFVGNCFCSQRVNHHNLTIGKSDFGSNPKQIGHNSNKNSDHNVDHNVARTSIVKNGLDKVERIQNYGYSRPNKIAVGSENCFCSHRFSIISDESKREEGIS